MVKLLLFILPLACGAQSMLMSVAWSDWGPREEYLLQFNKTPDCYFPHAQNNRLTVKFCNTLVSDDCLEAIKGLPRPVSLAIDTGCMAQAIVGLQTGDDALWETLPFAGAFIITLQPKDLEMVWEKSLSDSAGPRIAPLSMRLFACEDTDKLYLSLPAGISSAMVWQREGFVSVGIYGSGAPVAAETVRIKSRFIKTLSFATATTDSISSEGVTVFDIETRKGPVASWDYSGSRIRILFRKG